MAALITLQGLGEQDFTTQAKGGQGLPSWTPFLLPLSPSQMLAQPDGATRIVLTLGAPKLSPAPWRVKLYRAGFLSRCRPCSSWSSQPLSS